MPLFPELYGVYILSTITASLITLTGIARQRQAKLRRERALALAAAKRN